MKERRDAMLSVGGKSSDVRAYLGEPWFAMQGLVSCRAKRCANILFKSKVAENEIE